LRLDPFTIRLGCALASLIWNKAERGIFFTLLPKMRGDDAAPHTMENARRKAYTAMTFKQPTAEYACKIRIRWRTGR
jgi:hypothetical protein